MIADPVAGHDLQTTLNVVLAKTAHLSGTFGHWHDGSPVALPERKSAEPPPLVHDWGASRFKSYHHNFRKKSTIFTEAGQDGQVYRPNFDKLHNALKWTHEPNPVFAPHGYHLVLPAFFQTLCELSKQGRDFSVIIRTFGSDLPEIARCLRAFSEGLHPEFPAEGASLARFRLEAEDARWAILAGEGGHLRMAHFDRDLNDRRGALGQVLAEVKSEAEMVRMLEETSILGVRDDYNHWSGNRCAPWAGKPLWLSPEGAHHIFFDDNIHNDPRDSIVAVRARRALHQPFTPLSGEAAQALHGCVSVKVFPGLAIADRNYFLNHIAACEQQMAQRRFTDLLPT